MSNKFIENVKKIAEKEFPEIGDRTAKMLESELSKKELAKMLAMYVVTQYYHSGTIEVVGADELFANVGNGTGWNFEVESN